MKPGEILVTVATEPAWTPVFVNASGVVLEVGGGLQHGAIIAREYGIPCVNGLPGVTKIIKDGDMLEVDGINDIVKILEEDVDVPQEF
jgi:rifampicin phosphotransferase